MQLDPVSPIARAGIRRRLKTYRLKHRARVKAKKHQQYEAKKAADQDFLAKQRILTRAYYAANRAHVLKRTAQYAKDHPEVKHAATIRRRQRRLGVNDTATKIDRAAIIKRDRSICHICHKHVRHKAMTLDHLIPLIHGGRDTADNLAVAHRSCNARRGTGRLPAQLRLFG